MNELFSFYRNALNDGLCEEYKDCWRGAASDKLKLATLCMRQQSIPYFATYCYQGKGLSKEYITDEFSDFLNKKSAIQDADEVKGYTYSLWIGENGVLSASDDVLHLMWCNGTLLSVNASKCPNIYISNKSNVKLACDGFNSVRIYLFDESRLTLEDIDENSDIIVYRYSNMAVVEEGRYCFGRIKTFNKKLRL